MYQNGKRIEGYLEKRLHKRKMKDRHAKKYAYGPKQQYTWTQLLAYHADEPGALDYWREYYLAKKECKNAASRRIRNIIRAKIARGDYEDMDLPQSAEYRKYYDYQGEVW